MGAAQGAGVSTLDTFPHRIRPAAGTPSGALVLLHGRGTDENDLQPLADALDPERRLVAITPRGPLRLPPGGAHWYAVPRVGYPDPSTFHPTYAALAAWMDAVEEATGVPWSRTVLGGFSQGAVMSYALGLGAGRPSPAGLIALSGFIPVVADFDVELDGREGLPVAIGHGTLDPIISVDFARKARERLEPAGLELTYRESPMPHTIDPGFMAELRPWLERVLRPVTTPPV
jgi:phospholipase/carboxylesterase